MTESLPDAWQSPEEHRIVQSHFQTLRSYRYVSSSSIGLIFVRYTGHGFNTDRSPISHLDANVSTPATWQADQTHPRDLLQGFPATV